MVVGRLSLDIGDAHCSGLSFADYILLWTIVQLKQGGTRSHVDKNFQYMNWNELYKMFD